MSWKIGDLCVAKSKQFGWTNSEIKQINEDVGHVEFIEYEGDEEVNISDLKLFGPFVVNKMGELVEGNNDAGDYAGWKVGDACVAQWTLDGAWYNSQILHFFNEDEILVRFVDYGNADFKALGNLRPAGSPLENAVRQSLKSSSSSINDSKTEVRQRTMKRASFALEEKRSENTTRPWRVFDECVSRWSADGLWYMSRILAITGQHVTVLFTQYGNKGVTTLDQLKHVNALEECDDIKTSWKVGDLCVALWKEDGVWYNSQIVNIKDDSVFVRFTDYGNQDYTTLDQLKPFGSLDGELIEEKFTLVKKTSSRNERDNKWKVGDMCVARWNQDRVWYDSEIVEIDGEKVLVRFVEYGNEDYTTLGQLKPADSLPSNAEGMDTLGELQPAGSLPSNTEGTDKEKTWAVGDLCVARWEEDQVWYNGKIMEIHGEKALVQFVDYGNEDLSRLSQLKPAGTLELKDVIKDNGALLKCKGAIPKVNKGAISKIKNGTLPKVKISSSEKQLPTSEKKAATVEEISNAKGRSNVPNATSQKRAATEEEISVPKATSQKKAATEEEIIADRGRINAHTAFGHGRARGHPDTSQYSIRNDVSTPENISEQLENIFPYFSPEFLLVQARKYGTIKNAVNEHLNCAKVLSVSVPEESAPAGKTDEDLFTRFMEFPPEIVLKIFMYMDPEDILKIAQTCRLLRSLSEDDKLWDVKCKEEGLIYSLNFKDEEVFVRRNTDSFSRWKTNFYKHLRIKANFCQNPIRQPVVLGLEQPYNHRLDVHCVEFVGNKIVSAALTTNTMKIWDPLRGICLDTLEGHNEAVTVIEVDDPFIISGSADNSLKVWNSETGECIRTLQGIFGHTDTVFCLHFFEGILVSGSRDGTVRLWNIQERSSPKVFVGHLEVVTCVQFNGKLVASGSRDRTVKIWDSETAECLHTFVHTSGITKVKFSGFHVMSSSWDEIIRVWDLETGTCMYRLEPIKPMVVSNRGNVMKLHGNLLVSGHLDSTVKIWNTLTWNCLKTLDCASSHGEAVTALDFNDNFVVTGSSDGKVKLWDIKTGQFERFLLVLEGSQVKEIMMKDTMVVVCANRDMDNVCFGRGKKAEIHVLNFDIH